jgi:hypothetical protein
MNSFLNILLIYDLRSGEKCIKWWIPVSFKIDKYQNLARNNPKLKLLRSEQGDK